MARVIVLGAGFGGIAAAIRLRARLAAEDEVLLVDRQATFMMGLRKTWAVVGAGTLDDGTRRLEELLARGIAVRQGTIEAVDPAARRVRVDGEALEADALVIALGAEQVPGAVPGLEQHGINAWDRSQAGRAHDALAALDRGRLLVGIFGTPYACPPGPYELALLADEALRARGASVEVEVFGPMPIALPAVGPVESAKVEALLEAAGITFRRGHAAVAVEDRVVRFAGGETRSFDLLLAVPPHRCPPLLVEAGLAPAGGWVAIDPATTATPFPLVHAVGDCTAIPLVTGMALPKAGLFAEAEGYVAAERIAAALAGRMTDAAFEGEGVCYAEVGGGRAVRIDSRFLGDSPTVTIEGPSAESMDGKLAFEADRLRAWFGR